MIRLVRPVAAIALLAAALPATPFVRETTTPRHPESGYCLWWGTRRVTYEVNATSANPSPCQSASAAEAVAAAAFATWGAATRSGEASACTDFAFVHGAPTTRTAVGRDGVNLVVFRSGLCSDVVGLDPCSAVPGACAAKFNCWEHEVGTIGLTTTTFDTDTGEILDADMELFGWNGEIPPTGSYFTCESPAAPRCDSPPYGQTGCNWVDVGAVVVHEAGHVLGLDHVCDSAFPAPYDACPAGPQVMAPSVGDVALRGLSQDDVEGICRIYPAGAATLTCAPPHEKPKGGCSSAGEVGIAGLLGVAVAAWRGRRRGR